jgi:hypothetical protein
MSYDIKAETQYLLEEGDDAMKQAARDGTVINVEVAAQAGVVAGLAMLNSILMDRLEGMEDLLREIRDRLPERTA